MVKRRRLALIYLYNENWIAGTYYIENIIFSLNTIKEEQKPLIIIYAHSKETFSQLKNKTEYRYLKFRYYYKKLNFLERLINKTSRLLIRKNKIDKRPIIADFDFVFPNPYDDFFAKIDQSKIIYWIPDFQEDHLPQFFSSEEVDSRKQFQQKVAQNAKIIVFSSRDASNDFIRLYPFSRARKVTLPFAVRINLSVGNEYLVNKIIQKYNIEDSFFLVPNQLWIHKNHKTLIKAIKELSTKLPGIKFIFTGKEADYRFPDYPLEVKKMVTDFGLQNQARFLGFIPREDLECLIFKAKAIIQPSLFEGWSTVIEEAKTFNKFIFASDITIHLEQLERYPNKIIFNRTDPHDLAFKINQFLSCDLNLKEYDYKSDMQHFAKGFLSLSTQSF